MATLHRSWAAAFLAFCLLAGLASPASAAPLVAGTVAGLSLAGDPTLEGKLLALRSTGGEDPSHSGGAPPSARIPPAEIRLHARSLHVETDIENATGSPLASAPQRSTQSFDTGAAHGIAGSARQGFQFYVAPMAGRGLPDAVVKASSMTLTSAAAAPSEPDRHVPTGRPLVPAGPGAGVQPGPSVRSLHVEGDIVLVLWEMDLLVTDASGSRTVPSGYSYVPVAPTVANMATIGQYEERQVFVHATGAVLDLTFPIGAAATSALAPSAASWNGRATFDRPQGTLATPQGPQPLTDGDWLEGRLQASFGLLGATSFAVAVDGAATGASLGGRAVAPGPGSHALAWGLSLGGLAAAVAGAFVARHAANRRLTARVKRAMDGADYATVVRLTARRVLGMRRQGDALRAQRTVALLLLGKPNDAATALQGWKEGPQATCDYLWACVHALRGESQQAAARVQSCLRADPKLATQLLGDPLLSLMRPAPDKRSDGYA